MKLLILDIDGVLTDGKKYYGLDGMPFAKTYCDKDFTAIKMLKASGMKICFLSGDNRINEPMAKNRNIDFYYARGKDKSEFIPEFELKYGVNASEMGYVGDDLFDIGIMEEVGYKFCPSDASKFVTDLCGSENIIPRNGGNNAIAVLVDMLLQRGLTTRPTMQAIEDLDKNEKF